MEMSGRQNITRDIGAEMCFVFRWIIVRCLFPQTKGGFSIHCREKKGGENIFLRLARKQKERRTVGFYGVDSGVGTTHLAIAAANFAAGEWGVPTAVAELSGHPCIQDMDLSRNGSGHFELEGVDYYPQMESTQMPQLLNLSYRYLILDMGCNENSWQEFLRCDLKYVVASFCPWRMRQAEIFMDTHETDQTKKYFTALLTVTGNVYEKKRFQRKYHVPVRTIPFIADPFRLEKDQLSFFQELL